MRLRAFALTAFLFLAPYTNAFGQDHPTSTPQSKAAGDSAAKKDAEAELELQKALGSSGNDRAALVRNLKDYIQRFPDAPRRGGVYRALVEACGQLRDNGCALDYAERLIAIQPEDNEIMMLAVDLLKQQGGEAGLTRASGYASRVLDRIQKSNPDERPPRTSLPEWQDHHEKLLAALYFQRGQIENLQRKYDAAVKDLQSSFSTRANASAAEALGEIAEMRRDPVKAIEQYALAFALPEAGPAGKVDRREIRRKLGNVWRQVHGSEQGLAEQILASYDQLAAPAAVANPSMHNKGAKDPFDFVLRRIDGSSLPLAPFKGKTLVLSFWATWCGPCRELEPVLGRVERSYEGNSNIAFFAANTDEDETLVAPFLARVKWDVTVVYADGLDDFLKVSTLPTVLILDRDRKIVYRIGGYSPEGFSESLNVAILAALNPAK